MKEKKDFFDSIDDFFTQLNSEETSKKIQKGIDSLNEMPNKINDAIKNKGYDNVQEFFQGEFSDKKREEPQVRMKHLSDFSSRMAYIKDALTNFQYDLKYRGYYKEGHIQAIQHILTLLPQYQNDLDPLISRIQLEINELTKVHSNQNVTFNNGYIQGCNNALQVIHQSKLVFMRQVLNQMRIKNT